MKDMGNYQKDFVPHWTINLRCATFLFWFQGSSGVKGIYTFPFGSLDSAPSNLSRSWDSASETGGDQRSFPPGFDEALLYHIIPNIAIIMPKTTCQLSPSFPKKAKPMISTKMVFMWPSTWKVTAENLPMQMNWLRLVPIAMEQESIIKNCRKREKEYYSIHQNTSILVCIASVLQFRPCSFGL